MAFPPFIVAVSQIEVLFQSTVSELGATRRSARNCCLEGSWRPTSEPLYLSQSAAMSKEVSIAFKLSCISQLKTNVALALGDVQPVTGGGRRVKAEKHPTRCTLEGTAELPCLLQKREHKKEWACLNDSCKLSVNFQDYFFTCRLQ